MSALILLGEGAQWYGSPRLKIAGAFDADLHSRRSAPSIRLQSGFRKSNRYLKQWQCYRNPVTKQSSHMPRRGGEADKFGNRYEAVWTVNMVLDVFEGRFKSIVVEPFGSESKGIEFKLSTSQGATQFHSVKRQKSGGDWSIADLCRQDKKTKRSILGDLFEKTIKYRKTEMRFVSATGANELKELSERAINASNLDKFSNVLSEKLRRQFETQIVPIFDGNYSKALSALRKLEVVLASDKLLINHVEQRIYLLFNKISGAAFRPDDLRRKLAEFVLDNLDQIIDKKIIKAFLHQEGFGIQDWKLDETVQESVDQVNRGYISSVESELINLSHIDRDITTKIIDEINKDKGASALVVAPGGFGKSCVLVQCQQKLLKSNIPHLCFGLDSLSPCNTTRQIGTQLGLRASPVTVLAGIAQNKSTVLIIDQLDAISLISGRNSRMWDVFQKLWEETQSYPKMKVILACRDFDLEHDHRLRSLVGPKFGCVKFSLSRLTDHEIRHAVTRAGLDSSTLRPQQLEILAIPFHLLLFLQGDQSTKFSGTNELYDTFWKRKRDNIRMALGRSPCLNEVISAVTKYMSENQVLFAPIVIADEWSEDAEAMVSSHILVEIKEQKKYKFFHESFFDYSYARRFSSNGMSVVDLLISSEQHLFRRAQVRQILTYRRSHDFSRYLCDLQEILSSSKVRFHIKRMTASEMRRINDPKGEEWNVIRPHLIEGELASHLCFAITNHIGWFDLLDSLNIFETWLASEDLRFISLTFEFFEAIESQKCRLERIAQLIGPYVKYLGGWRKRVLSVLSKGHAYRSIGTKRILMDFIDNGVYDDAMFDGNGDGFWIQFYATENDGLIFFIDILCKWLVRIVGKYDDGRTMDFIKRCKKNQSSTIVSLVCKAAEREPEYFVEQLLPIVNAVILKTKLLENRSTRNRAWPYLSNRAPESEIDEAIITALRKALQVLALNNVSKFRSSVQSVVSNDDRVISYFLLRSWAHNPKEFADECAEYMLSDMNKINLGYDCATCDDEGSICAAISRMALLAITPHCSKRNIRNLEERIIGFVDESEKNGVNYACDSELLLLRSLDKSRISVRSAQRIKKLEEEFPQVSDVIVKEDHSSAGERIDSDSRYSTFEDMDDISRAREMLKSSKQNDLFSNAHYDFGRVISESCRKNRRRVWSLVRLADSNVNPIYFSSILNGLCGNSVNLTADNKKVDDDDIASVSNSVFLKVIDRLHNLPNRPCGGAIVDCIGRIANRKLPERVLDIVSYYAISDADPSADNWKKYFTESRSSLDDPYNDGINSVRGKAAESIAALLWSDSKRIHSLLPALRRLSIDKAPSVRACAINALLPVLNISADQALDMFRDACSGCDEVMDSTTFNRFLYYAAYKNYSEIEPIIENALLSANGKAVRSAARTIILAELEGHDVGIKGRIVERGDIVKRKAAVEIYAANIFDSSIGKICESKLEKFLNDEADDVRQEISGLFFNAKNGRLLKLNRFISKYIASKSFEVHGHYLLRSLVKSNDVLPEVICDAVERVLGLVDGGRDMDGDKIMFAMEASKLVLRQYEQTKDAIIQTRCLDIIDRMESGRFFGISDELEKIDR